MKWLLGVVCVVASSCAIDDPNCVCTSTISISLGNVEYGVLQNSTKTVKLCLDDECHTFDMKNVSYGMSAPSNDTDPSKAMSVVIEDNPSRLLFITRLKHTKDTRTVKLEFSSSSEVLQSRTWEDAPFTPVPAVRANGNEQECTTSCTSVQLN